MARFRHGDVAVRQFRYLKPEAEAEEGGESPDPPESRSTNAEGLDPYILLALKRGERWEPMFEDLEIEADEISAVAIYEPAAEAAEEALARVGWVPAEPDPH